MAGFWGDLSPAAVPLWPLLTLLPSLSPQSLKPASLSEHVLQHVHPSSFFIWEDIRRLQAGGGVQVLSPTCPAAWKKGLHLSWALGLLLHLGALLPKTHGEGIFLDRGLPDCPSASFFQQQSSSLIGFYPVFSGT